MAKLRTRFKIWDAYIRDVSGVAAVEFALILPILFALFLGVVEYARATMYARRLDQVTAMLSDLVTREEKVDDASFVGIKAGIDTAWGTFDDIDNLKFSIKSVRRTGTTADNDTTYVHWDKEIRGAPTAPKCTPYTPPNPDMIGRGYSLIVVTGSYTYNTMLGVALPAIGLKSNQLQWTTLSHHSPRNTVCVGYNGVDCVTDLACE